MQARPIRQPAPAGRRVFTGHAGRGRAAPRAIATGILLGLAFVLVSHLAAAQPEPAAPYLPPPEYPPADWALAEGGVFGGLRPVAFAPEADPHPPPVVKSRRRWTWPSDYLPEAGDYPAPGSRTWLALRPDRDAPEDRHFRDLTAQAAAIDKAYRDAGCPAEAPECVIEQLEVFVDRAADASGD